MVANSTVIDSTATRSEPSTKSIARASSPPQLLLPLDALGGLSVETLTPANGQVERVLSSGEAQAEYARLVRVCCADVLSEAEQEQLRRRFLSKVRLDLFARYWSPESATAASVVAQFTFLTALFAADDVRDSCGADPEHTALIARTWRAVPALVDELWQSQSEPSTDFESLFSAASDRLPLDGVRDLDAQSRLLAMACAQVRVAAGSDAAYAWFARECATWGEHSFAIREKDMGRVALPELLLHRYREGATTLTILHMLVSSGLPFTSKLVAALSAGEASEQDLATADTSLFVSAGLHICLVNDILSYDRDELEAGFLQNFVEYQRRFCPQTSGDLDAAMSETARHSNVLAAAMGRAASQLREDLGADDDVLRVVLDTAARAVLGNIRWSVECGRYSRTDFVRAMVAAP